MAAFSPLTDPSIGPSLRSRGPFADPDYTPEFGSDSISESKILVIGAGGLGCEILKNLVLSGFRDIHVIDMDTIDVSNLNRQFLFRKEDVGRSKAIAASEFVMRRIRRGVRITPYFGKIQDKPKEYYRGFTLVICGLDSVEARRWINATLVDLAAEGDIVPMVDGGTEGFRGQTRVIIPTISSCYECSLDLLPTKRTFPVCTIANTPRLPEHCIEWAHQLLWPKNFPQRKFDADLEQHVDWIYDQALFRANEFGIEGVTRSLTLGVVKNIVPAIASTNAIIAASCCNEAFKFVTSCNPVLDNYMMYSGDQSVYSYSFCLEKKPDCPVCGSLAQDLTVPRFFTLQELLDLVAEKPKFQLKAPSVATSDRNLYLRFPEQLETLTRPNLELKLIDLISESEELLITDRSLPLSLKLRVRFTGDSERPKDSGNLSLIR
ncbi:unnamed protein product [Kuraishia capsulata CBS 1993]|uniref:NEDD8-activating enzyme E1 catalytic subunit n=1 Tax=Kuraishia capsulata CBS 1993 TaxID=1382522 RepID=W6MRH7_9ASCO|nr:uncharacterized protein KUCA_T00005344001 [Kuraishia capsulata CBS 1993]CDK29356.1 unnamed protein product [Kuraishia capsulata CBS 1993]